MEEEWREVPGFPGYAVSDQGRVRGKSGRVLRPDTTRGGYLRVTMRQDGADARRSVHRVVLLAFVGGPPKDKPHCGHRNGVPNDNRLANLRWVSRSENEIEKRQHGTSNRGVGNGRARLTESQVREIKRRLLRGESQQVLAKEFDTPSVTINHINTGRTWGHVNA